MMDASTQKPVIHTLIQASTARRHEHSELMAIIEEFDSPIRRIDSTMTSVYDELQGYKQPLTQLRAISDTLP